MAISAIDSMQVVKPTPLTWLEALGLALVNWLGAWACLVACIIAVHGRVPWRGVLVAYAVGQVAASLPITPGGLGVVEGSITGLLVAYDMPTKTALAGVLLFRVVSFWALVPVGCVIYPSGRPLPARASARASAIGFFGAGHETRADVDAAINAAAASTRSTV